LYAQIFYDSQNGAYYVDPAGASNLNTLTLASGSVLGSEVIFNNMNLPHTTYGNADNVGFGFRYLQGGSNYPGISGATQYYGMTLGLGSDYAFSAFASQFYWPRLALGGLPYPSVRFRESGTWGAWTKIYAGWADAPSGATFAATGDFRAPIFYDSDNTTYYIDPASGSNLVGQVQINGGTIMSGGWNRALYLASQFPVIVMNSGSVKYSGIGVDYTEAQSGMVFWVNGNSADITNGSATVALRINTGNFVTAAGSFRAPIFYDLDNTAYYLDAANYSVLSNIQLGVNYTSGGGGGRIIIGPGSPYSVRQEFGSDNTGWRYGIAKNVGGTVTIQFYVSDSGTAEAVGDMRAPIFYDSSNTGYYLDPASTGTSLNVAGNIIGVGELRTSGQITNANYMVGGSQNGAVNIGRNDLNYRWEGTNWGSTTTLGLLANCLDYWEFGIHDSGSKVVSPLYYDGGARFLMGRDIGWGTTYIEAASNFRAPLFYDSQNTAYYVDPNSNSVLYKFENINQRVAYDRAWDNYPSITVYNTTDQGPQNDFRIHGVGGANGGDFNVRLLVDGTIQSLSDVQAPIFYDSNDTAFYMNPNAGSRFQTIDVNDTIYSNNWFRSYGSTGWYNQSYAGGIFMQDTTWVRVYNGKAFYVPNEIAATGNITAYYSDERLKTKTGGIDNALEKLSGLSGFLYVENDLARSLGYSNDKQQVGVSAQAVQAVLPEAVSLAPVDFETLEDGTIVSKSGENYLTVDYSRLVPLLIEAIKELENKVKALEAKEQ
jgi:hypothetical protein